MMDLPMQHAPMTASPAQRLDKWLWFARLVKTREDAVALCESRHLRMDGRVIDKAHANVREGALIAFPRGNRVMVLRVTGFADRRGPASETIGLYEDMTTLCRRELAMPTDSGLDMAAGGL
jgi:ribosome-associated heat shock protein Hsp15